MANRDTTLFTQQDNRNVTRQYFPSLAALQQQLFIMVVEYTVPAGVTVANGDKIRLGYPGIVNAVLIPELSRVSNVDASGDIDLDVQLKSVAVDSAGTATETAITSATAASIDNNSVAFARLAAGTQPVIAQGDYIMALVSNYEAAAAGEILRFELAFRSANNIN